MIRFGPVASAIAILAAIGLLMAGLIEYVRVDAEAHLRAEVDADLTMLRIADSVIPAVQAMAILEKQSTDGFEYLVIDPVSGAKIDGTLEAWPQEAPDAQGWIASRVGNPPRQMIGRVGKLDGYFPIIVGRMAGGNALRDRALIGFSALALMAFGISLFASRRELSRTQNRLQRIDRQLRAFDSGDLDARIDDHGRDIVSTAARQINATLDRLAEMIRGKHLLAERIAHELRDPVALAVNRLDLVTTSANAIEEAREAMESLGETVDAILKLENVGTRDLTYEVVDLATAAAAVTDLYADTAAGRDQSFALDLHSARIWGEPSLIQQLIANLVSNAIKYAPPGSIIAVTTVSDGNTATLQVTDEGVGTKGLPDNVGAYLARGPSAQGVRGVGLGLAGVVRIAARHSGTARFEDRQDGSGLVAEIRFPAFVEVVAG